ncbi:hypothetical protein NEPAR07_2498, partial [Nematocida parisii]
WGVCAWQYTHGMGAECVLCVKRAQAWQGTAETGGDGWRVCAERGRECVRCVCSVQRQRAVRERVMSCLCGTVINANNSRVHSVHRAEKEERGRKRESV